MRFLTAILVLILFFSITGCGVKLVKDTDPIDIKIKYDRSKYNKEQNIKIVIQYGFRNQKSKSAKVVIEADEPVKIEGNKEYEYSDVDKIKDKTISVELAKPFDTNGFGEIRAYLCTFDESGNQLYSRGTEIYYLISDEEILMGSAGITNLRETHLKNLFNSGKITSLEYKHKMEELSREGVKIEITTTIVEEMK